MSRTLFLDDTITRRLIVTVALAAGVTLLLIELFFLFGGRWTKPDIQETGLPAQVATVIRMTQAAPAASRQALTQAAATDQLRFGWYPSGSSIATALLHGQYRPAEIEQGWDFLKPYLAHRPERLAVFQEDNPVSQLPGMPYDRSVFHESYFAALQCDDGSWILCIALQRFWGLYAFERFCLEAVLLTLWIIAVSAIASRQLSRPIEHLAYGVRNLGAQPRLMPLSEEGPREIRLVVETINAMQAQIRKFVTDRTTMLAAISHDLRTPLTRIRLRGEFIDDTDQQKLLFRDVDEMQAMIDGALSFFRDDALREENTMFDLSNLLQTIAYDYTDQGHDVRFIGPDRTGYNGPPYALRRVFSNLVENAIKYATAPQIVLSPAPDGSATIIVRDNGPGLPEAALQTVFEPYFRLDKSRNRQTGGVGLGLTSARTIIRALGGDIAMTNREQGGLDVCVFLPGPR
ncbi:two-component sensor histidine kinase [Asaia spathodeae]|uniref:ATP-binding protein n=1 Tax=Asaia spathodeae TaxID=657016 RepID=UPI002FC3870B